MENKIVTERINAIFQSLDISVSDFAKKLHISRQAVYGLFNGATPKNETVKYLANISGYSTDYILGLTSETSSSFDIFQFDNIHPVQMQRVPMLGKIACGTPMYADEERESYILAGTDIKADFCLTARGDSMIGARIMDGDIVFCRAQDTVENGEIGIVIIGDEATLKRVYLYPEKKKLVLQAENPKYEPFVYVGEELADIRIIGKAIAFQSDIK